MKKIYTLLVASIIASSVSAQVDLQTTLIKPTAGTTVSATVAFDFEIVVTVVSGSVNPTDTVWYGFTDGSSIFGRRGLTKNAGDTIQFKNSLSYGSGVTPKTNYEWCSWSFIRTGNTDPNHANDTACTTINIINTVSVGNGPASVSPVAENIKLNIAPNPAVSEIVLDYISSGIEVVNARIIDISGRTVNIEHISSYNGKKDYKLDISTLNSGIYFVELTQGERRGFGKFIKQ